MSSSTSSANEPERRRPLELEFLGQTVTPYGTSFGGLQIGGLSAIAYDAASDAYLALSDDRSPQARFFTVRLDLSDGALSTGDQSFTGVQVLADADGPTFRQRRARSRGPRHPRRTARSIFSSEGDANALVRAAGRDLERVRHADGHASR